MPAAVDGDHSAEALRRRRLRAQRLDAAARADDADVARVVRAVGGIQAQDMRAATLGVAVRSGRLTGTDIAAALEVSRTVARAWCMRGTLHLVPADLLAPLLAVFGPLLVARGRRRLADLGLDEAACRRGVAVIGEVLAGGALRTRDEIAAALRRDGDLELRGQAAFHLVRRACLEGVACEAGSRDGRPAYGLRGEWFPAAPPPPRPLALGALARWYVDGFAPVSRDDFAAWSGLPAEDVRTAWGQVDDLVEVAPELWAPAPDPGPPPGQPPTVRLAPAFDGYLLGYHDRRHAVAPQHQASVHPGGGIIRATVLVDGRVTGIWSLRRAGGHGRLVVATFSGLPGVPVGALDTEAARIGTALDLDVSLAMVG